MPLMVGNIVVLNSGSPPMTVKAITHAGQVLCQWIDSGASYTRWSSRPRCCRTSIRHRGQTDRMYRRSLIKTEEARTAAVHRRPGPVRRWHRDGRWVAAPRPQRERLTVRRRMPPPRYGTQKTKVRPDAALE